MAKRIEIIEAASEIGAGKRGAGKGPATVLHLLQQKHSPLLHGAARFKVLDLNEETIPELSPYARRISGLTEAMSKLSGSVEHSLKNGFFPLLLSGDHSNAIGSVSGFKNYYADQTIGVIWVDAHLDLHSPFTTPSGNIHGMALNALLANDNEQSKKNEPSEDALAEWHKLKSLGSLGISPKVLPENIVFIGVRDFEPEEMALVESLGITVIQPDEIAKNGIEYCLQKTLDRLSNCDKIYVSFDVDSLDTTISVGTGTPVDGGLNMEEAEIIFKTLFHHPKVGAFEITEINPDLDTDNKMSEAAATLINSVV
jgi:arginase